MKKAEGVLENVSEEGRLKEDINQIYCSGASIKELFWNVAAKVKTFLESHELEWLM